MVMSSACPGLVHSWSDPRIRGAITFLPMESMRRLEGMTVGQAIRVFFKGSWAVLTVWTSPSGQASTLGMARMQALVLERFGVLPHLTTDQLSAWMSDPTREQPFLLDVRSMEEFEVSHLAGAAWASPHSQASELMARIPADRPVVVYCSIGYRSAQCVSRLLEAGFTRVMNLEGSLFQWANEGRPLARFEGPASQVHPYSSWFGKLLRPEMRAKVTSTSLPSTDLGEEH